MNIPNTQKNMAVKTSLLKLDDWKLQATSAHWDQLLRQKIPRDEEIAKKTMSHPDYLHG